ncbi:hypothetical protein V5799_025890 [Amblyomma americanum]|uniref:Uncharacterized protein n=1 Tax=Amblyomma americanum TaxID=6943 RepID=A0AAQ4E818_AMBAM
MIRLGTSSVGKWGVKRQATTILDDESEKYDTCSNKAGMTDSTRAVLLLSAKRSGIPHCMGNTRRKRLVQKKQKD